MQQEALNHIKYHVDQIKREKANVEPTTNMPGVELLYEKYLNENAVVHKALLLWERHPEVSVEQALVQLVDVLVQQNDSMRESLLNLHQTSIRPIIK